MEAASPFSDRIGCVAIDASGGYAAATRLTSATVQAPKTRKVFIATLSPDLRIDRSVGHCVLDFVGRIGRAPGGADMIVHKNEIRWVNSDKALVPVTSTTL